MHDQQLAGVLMKIGNLPVIWTVMGVIFFRWYETDQRRSVNRRRAVTRPREDPEATGRRREEVVGPQRR